MVLSRLQHLLETFLPVLFFTFTDLVDPISVFSVAGLVAAFVVLVLAIHYLAFFYITLVTFFPGVVDYGLPGLSFILEGYLLVAAASTASALYLRDVVVSLLPFLVYCVALVILSVSPYAHWYWKTLRKTKMQRRLADAEISQLVALNREIGCQLLPALTKKKKQLEEVKAQIRAVESDIEHDLSQLPSEQELVGRFQGQRERVMKEQHIEVQRILTAHIDQLRNSLATANREYDALAAARAADIQLFDEERAALEAENAALKGAVATAVAKHLDHKQRSQKDQKLTKKRFDEQFIALETAREASAQQLAAAEHQASSLRAENKLLTERLASADTAREAIATSYRAHVEESEHRLATHEAQYATLQDSSRSLSRKHRRHLADREQERADSEDVVARLAAKNTAYEELKADHDAIVLKNLEMKEAYEEMEARLKAAERALYLERSAHRPQADYQVSPATKATPGFVSESTFVNSRMKPSPFPLSSSKSPSKPPGTHFVQGSSKDAAFRAAPTPSSGATEPETCDTHPPSPFTSASSSKSHSSAPLNSRGINERHAIFASGAQNSSTSYKAESIPKPLPRSVATNAVSERVVHDSPDPRVLDDKFRRIIVAMESTSAPRSAARAKHAPRPVATGNDQQTAPRRAESNALAVAPSSPIAEEDSKLSLGSSPKEESSEREVFANGVKNNSAPWTTCCHHVSEPSPHQDIEEAHDNRMASVAAIGPTSTAWVTRHTQRPPVHPGCPTDTMDEPRGLPRESCTQRPAHSLKASTISPEAGPSPHPDFVEDRSRYTRFMSHLNATSTPRDVQDYLGHLIPKSRRAPAGVQAPIDDPATLPEEESADDSSQSSPESLGPSSYARNEDRHQADASSLRATSPPAQSPQEHSPPPPPPPPPSPPPPSSPSPLFLPPLSRPPASLPQAKEKPKSQLQTSESFFQPQAIEPGFSKTFSKFELKSRLPPLPEFIEGSSKDGLPQGKTPAIVRRRRESRYVPGSPETPCHQSLKPAGAVLKALLNRLEGELGPSRRTDKAEQ